MPECAHCGAHVSQQFVTVFGLDGGDVVACPACSGRAHIAETIVDRYSVPHKASPTNPI
ncbi:DUF7563 family protein (plasmid) [Halorubrum xinjiangense]